MAVVLAELPEGEVVDSPRPSEREDQLSDLRQQLANTMLPETHQPTPQTQNLPSGRPVGWDLAFKREYLEMGLDVWKH